MQYICRPCAFCGKTATLDLDADKLKKFRAGVMVQQVFPELSAGDRELLISGTHDECWEKHMKTSDSPDWPEDDFNDDDD